MKKHIEDGKAYVSTTFSLVNLKARFVRAGGSCVAYMIGTGSITSDMTWESFITSFSSPIHAIGMAGVLLLAGSTSGGRK